MNIIRTFCIVLLNVIAFFLEAALFIVGCVLIYYQLYAFGIIAIILAISAAITQMLRILELYG